MRHPAIVAGIESKSVGFALVGIPCLAIGADRVPSAASTVLATVIPTDGRGWRNIVRWVLVEETIRLQQKTYVGGRHNRAIFWSRDMGVAKGVPEDDI